VTGPSLGIYFYKGPEGIFGTLVRWWTGSPYSHCVVVLGYENGHFELYEARNGVGTVKREITPEIDLRQSQWDHVNIPVSPDGRTKVFTWLESELGCPYDWAGLWWSQVLKLPRPHPHKWFCSEYAADALEQLGMLVGAEPCTFSPGSLWRVLTTGKYT
jgi:hypothetical protein